MDRERPFTISFEQAPLCAGLLALGAVGAGAMVITASASPSVRWMTAVGFTLLVILAHRSYLSRAVGFDPDSGRFVVSALLSLSDERCVRLWSSRPAAADQPAVRVEERSERRPRGGGETRWYAVLARLRSGAEVAVHRRLAHRLDADELAARLLARLTGNARTGPPTFLDLPMPLPPRSTNPRPGLLSFDRSRISREAFVIAIALTIVGSFTEIARTHAGLSIGLVITALALIASRSLWVRRVEVDPASDLIRVTRLLSIGPGHAIALRCSEFRLDRPIRAVVQTRHRPWLGGCEHTVLIHVAGDRLIAAAAPFESLVEAERAAAALPRRIARAFGSA